MDGVIDLDAPAAPAAPAAGRRVVGGRVAAVAALALAAAVPPVAPATHTAAHTVPVPSYCSGRPIPGGRLNIVEHGRYVILDATTNTVVGSGACPR